MFKDELNIAFENVRPAPELLDKISAMMSEEANRKKAPLQMRAVRYAGIAAAVALAAGGTMLVVNNANNGVKTSSANYVVADAAAPAAEPEIIKTSEASEAAEAAEAQAEENYAMDEAAKEDFEDELGASMFIAAAEEADGIDNSMRIAAAGMADETLPAETLSQSTSAYPAEITTTTAADAGRYDYEGAEAPAMDAVSPYAIDMDTYQLKSDEAGPEAAEEVQLLNDEAMSEIQILPAQVEQAANDNATAGASDNEYMPIAPKEAAAPVPADDAADEAADSATKNPDDIVMMYKSRDFTDPCIQALDIRPVLIEEVGAEVFAEWQKTFGDDVPDSVTGYANLYTMIKHFELPKEKVASLVGEYITAEQLDLLYNGTVAEITAAFATEYSIVKDEKIYSPQWIKTHTEKDYEAAGISAEDLLSHDYVIIPE